MTPDPAAGLFLEALRLDLERPDDVRRRAEAALALGVGGFLLFGGEAEEAVELASGLRREAARPLWIAADLERGAGQQFRGLATWPPPAGLAAHPEPEAAVRRAAARTGRDALSVGVNWVLAPVLDLDLEPRNPIVGTRAFGADPEVVARLGRAWIEACQGEGVAACAKHFPGHGRTTADSHAELPVVEAGRDALEADLRPFREAAGVVAGVMTAHVAFPALGASGPATREPRLLRDLLRGELGFGGLVVTDALVMAGFGGAAAPAALLAGCDLLLYPPDLEAAVRSLGRAAETDGVVAGRIRESLARSAALLGRFPGPGVAGASGPGDGGEEEAVRVAAECVVPIGDPGAAAALDPGGPLRVLAVWDDREAPGRAPLGRVFAAELAALGWSVVPPAGVPGAAPGAPAGDADRTPGPAVLLVAATPQAWKGTAGLTPAGREAVIAAVRRGRTFPIVLGHPRILEGLGMSGACAWGAEESAERAAARWLDRAARSGGGAPAAGPARGRWES